MDLMGGHILWPPSHAKKTYERYNRGSVLIGAVGRRL